MDATAMTMFRSLVDSTVHPDRRNCVYPIGTNVPPVSCTHCRNVGFLNSAHHVSACPVIAANVCNMCHRVGHLPSRCIMMPVLRMAPLHEVPVPLPRAQPSVPPPPPDSRAFLDTAALLRVQKTMALLPTVPLQLEVPSDEYNVDAYIDVGQRSYGAAVAAAAGYPSETRTRRSSSPASVHWTRYDDGSHRRRRSRRCRRSDSHSRGTTDAWRDATRDRRSPRYCYGGDDQRDQEDDAPGRERNRYTRYRGDDDERSSDRRDERYSHDRHGDRYQRDTLRRTGHHHRHDRSKHSYRDDVRHARRDRDRDDARRDRDRDDARRDRDRDDARRDRDRYDAQRDRDRYHDCYEHSRSERLDERRDDIRDAHGVSYKCVEDDPSRRRIQSYCDRRTRRSGSPEFFARPAHDEEENAASSAPRMEEHATVPRIPSDPAEICLSV